MLSSIVKPQRSSTAFFKTDVTSRRNCGDSLVGQAGQIYYFIIADKKLQYKQNTLKISRITGGIIKENRFHSSS